MRRGKKFLLWTVGIAVVIILIIIGVLALMTPSNNRDWSTDQAILPHAEFSDDKSSVLIHNIRNFTYKTKTDYVPGYYDKRFTIADLERVYYVVEPFSKSKGAAHTLLSFEFANNQFVAISVEIRKEKGETFSAWKGLFNRYELMYVIGDENDLIKLRSNYRNDDVYVYPINTSKDRAQALFISMLERANSLREHPEFYNSLTNNCTTNIAQHVNELLPGRVPFNLTLLFPRESDRYAYDLDLIDTDLPFRQAREYFHINERAKKYSNSANFSVNIRQPLAPATLLDATP
jgi:hypothetical protein